MLFCLDSMFKQVSCFSFLFGLTVFCNSAFSNIENEKWIYHYRDEKISFNILGHLRGSPQIPLNEIAQKFHLKVQFDPNTFKLSLFNPRTKLVAETYTYSDTFKFGSFQIRLSRPPTFEKSKLYFPVEFGDRVLTPLLTGEPPDLPSSIDSVYSTKSQMQPEKVDLIIDPGHGGNDWGAHIRDSKGKVIREKDLSLEWSQELASELESLGIRTGLTRNTDVFLTLFERSRIAAQHGAQFFLSFHLNSSSKKEHRGYEIYLLSLKSDDSVGRSAVAEENQIIPDDLPQGFERALADLRAEAQLESSLQWAKNLDLGLRKSGHVSNGKALKMGPFYVLYASQMPSVLLELGFLTNTQDRELLLNPAKRKALIQNIAFNLANDLKPGIRAR